MKHLPARSEESLASILRSGWESLPDHLEHRLLEIAKNRSVQRALRFSRIQPWLEGLLLIWLFGLVYLYRLSWLPWISRLVSRVAPESVTLTQSSLNPLSQILIVGLLGLGVWLIDRQRSGYLHSKH